MAAEDAAPAPSPALFADASLSMMDKCAKIFEYFDQDNDGALKFKELAALQLATAGTVLAPQHWQAVCAAFDIKASEGITLNHLRLTYKTPGASVDADYLKVFPKP
jgi:Ca2+-binding EF-hand superfamily protein